MNCLGHFKKCLRAGVREWVDPLKTLLPPWWVKWLAAVLVGGFNAAEMHQLASTGAVGMFLTFLGPLVGMAGVEIAKRIPEFQFRKENWETPFFGSIASGLAMAFPFAVNTGELWLAGYPLTEAITKGAEVLAWWTWLATIGMFGLYWVFSSIKSSRSQSIKAQ